ncbi:hypothetical protein ATY81_25535 [Rhizobium sp. R72]|nr:hypothetical protein ATY79_27450 [Rhizobium sp. R693]OWV99722.1 hypothetical protein ATY81_25535 [Rhizobium sp. R72]OWW00010.1 hypothetical protein ATY80_25535 [Rhizobium sp. R711]
MLYVIAAIAMTAITVIGLLYLLSSRLRDIGWPQYLIWVLLTPVFLPKFIAIPLPALATQGITLFFMASPWSLRWSLARAPRPQPQVELRGLRPRRGRAEVSLAGSGWAIRHQCRAGLL